MTLNDVLTGLNTQTAMQRSKDLEQARKDSVEGRKVGGAMGKDDFLMLLSAQLRYQDPLEPMDNSDFAAQLAQFSTLEQMQNMNTMLATMANYQSYSLIGKYVLANAYVDDVWTQIPGVVESVFTSKGTSYAQIGEYTVPLSAITDVFDHSSMLTPDMLINTSNNLIGRTVMAELNGKTVEGTVTRVTVDGGFMYALIDDGATTQYVPVGAIYDIRVAGTPSEAPGTGGKDNSDMPPVETGKYLQPDGEGYIESDGAGNISGRWDKSPQDGTWVFTPAGD